MSTYIFGEQITKCQQARNLVHTYNANRAKFITQAIDIISKTTEKEINEVALGRGRTELRVNIDTVIKKNTKLSELLTTLNLKNYVITHDEKKQIVKVLLEYFEGTGFNVTCTHNNTVTINWKEEVVVE